LTSKQNGGGFLNILMRAFGVPKILKIVVGLSGGVDSATTAVLLRNAGWDVTGVHLRLLKEPDPHLQKNEIDARAIAEHLGIPFITRDVSGQFENYVLNYFIREYLSGRTPNPCIFCNPLIKFRSLLDVACEAGADKIATGHYVRVKYDHHFRRHIISRGTDPKRDQSYFLALLTQEALAHFVAPLGEMSKDDVKRIARRFGLKAVERPTSQEICFVTGNYREFLKKFHEVRERLQPGDITDTRGKLLGRHKGLAYYTIGQREGLGISAPHPLYVVRLENKTNRVIVGEKSETFSSSMSVCKINWIALKGLRRERRAGVQIRYRHNPAQARLIPSVNGEDVLVEFDAPQASITPGQVAVFYQNDVVLGGGIIAKP